MQLSQFTSGFPIATFCSVLSLFHILLSLLWQLKLSFLLLNVSQVFLFLFQLSCNKYDVFAALEARLREMELLLHGTKAKSKTITVGKPLRDDVKFQIKLICSPLLSKLIIAQCVHLFAANLQPLHFCS